MYDLIIIGGGPGGVAAGVYAARKKIKTLLIAESFGGQSIVSSDIQNWIGDVSVSGFDLADRLEKHLRAQEGIEIQSGDLVTSVEKIENGFKVATRNGQVYETKFILLTTGSRRKKLDVPGEKEFDGKGVVYCSTCDAPIFRDKRVVVVGGGNAGLEGVRDAIPYASDITLLIRSELRGDLSTFEKVIANEKVHVVKNVVVTQVLGDKVVTGIEYQDRTTGEKTTLAVDGVFVEIGAVPNSEFVASLVERDARGEIIVDHKTQATSCLGIWAAGDVSDVLYKQNNISAGDAVKAILNIYDHLHRS